MVGCVMLRRRPPCRVVDVADTTIGVACAIVAGLAVTTGFDQNIRVVIVTNIESPVRENRD